MHSVSARRATAAESTVRQSRGRRWSGAFDVDPSLYVSGVGGDLGLRSVGAITDCESGVVSARAVAQGVVVNGDQLEGDGEVESAVWRG